MHDLVVLGGGPGGYATAFRAAVRGLDVALVEADQVGGTCLHRGCIPSKALLHVAGVVEEVHRGGELGLDVDLRGVDLDGLRGFRDRVVGTLHRGLRALVDRRAIAYHEGRGRLLDAGVVEVGDERVAGRSAVVATGSVPRSLPGVDIDGRVVVTSDEALRVDRLPRRALVVGAGAVGVEFATLWRGLGADVTLIEALDRVLPLEDVGSSRAIEQAFRRAGIDVATGARLEKVAVDGEVARVEVATPDGGRELEVDTVLVAVGRAPNTGDIGAEDLGVLDERGYVRTDDVGRTPADGLWAVGDVLPTLALAHAAFAEGFVVADAIAGLDTRPVAYEHVPRVTYCRPEVASVGLTEEQARATHGEAVTTHTYPLAANAKGIISGLTGHVKTVALDGGETLGVHIVAPHATDLIAEATLVTYWGAYPAEVADVVHAHPTLSEAVGEAFLATAGTPFHGH